MRTAMASLTQEEFNAARKQFQQSGQGNGRPAAAAQTKLEFDPGMGKGRVPAARGKSQNA